MLQFLERPEQGVPDFETVFDVLVQIAEFLRRGFVQRLHVLLNVRDEAGNVRLVRFGADGLVQLLELPVRVDARKDVAHGGLKLDQEIDEEDFFLQNAPALVLGEQTDLFALAEENRRLRVFEAVLERGFAHVAFRADGTEPFLAVPGGFRIRDDRTERAERVIDFLVVAVPHTAVERSVPDCLIGGVRENAHILLTSRTPSIFSILRTSTSSCERRKMRNTTWMRPAVSLEATLILSRKPFDLLSFSRISLVMPLRLSVSMRRWQLNSFALSAFHSIASRLVAGIFASSAQVFLWTSMPRFGTSTPTIGSPGIGEQQGEK